MIAFAGRHRLLILTLAVLAALAGTLVAAMTGGGPAKRAAAGQCPPGQRVVRADIEEIENAGSGGGEREKGEREKGERNGEKKADAGERGDYESHFKGKCAPVSHP